MNTQSVLIFTGILGFAGVAFGAFGAHALKNVLDDYGRDIWNKAVFYQMVHVLAILFAIVMKWLKPELNLNPALYAFIVGILLFSGSLYILALTNIKILGAITPFGGLAFLFGWLWIAWMAMKMG